jgi:hypothetical protein
MQTYKHFYPQTFAIDSPRGDFRGKNVYTSAFWTFFNDLHRLAGISPKTTDRISRCEGKKEGTI